MSRDRPESKKASYLLARFARFFRFGLGVKGAGGVFRSRRNTSSGLGVGAGSLLMDEMIRLVIAYDKDGESVHITSHPSKTTLLLPVRDVPLLISSLKNLCPTS